MQNQYEIELVGDLRTEVVHSATDSKILTDAPLDNNGKGRTFSPTDLLAVSVGSCMVTTMGIAADQFGICLLYTSPSPRDDELSRMPSSA